MPTRTSNQSQEIHEKQWLYSIMIENLISPKKSIKSYPDIKIFDQYNNQYLDIFKYIINQISYLIPNLVSSYQNIYLNQIS